MMLGNVGNVAYPAWREILVFAGEDPPSEVSEGRQIFAIWGSVFPGVCG